MIRVAVSAQAAEPVLRPAGARSVGVRRFAALVLHLTVRELRSTNHLTVPRAGAGRSSAELAQLAVLVFVFGRDLDFDIEKLAVYVFVGLVAWTWFATGIASASSAVLQRRYLVLQPRLPTAVVPLVAVAVPFVDVFLFALPVLVIMLLVTTGPTWGLLVCPLLIAVQLVLMAGLAWLLAGVSVFLRDVPNLVGVVLLMLFYLTPVFYVRDSVPEQFRWVLDINPLATIIEAYRSLLLGGPGPGTGAHRRARRPQRSPGRRGVRRVPPVAAELRRSPVSADRIRFEGAWKSYPRWDVRTLREAVGRRLPGVLGPGEQRWALRDISLTVGRGEFVGVVGQNGAGKSTLLRLAAGLTAPTRGRDLLPAETSAILSLGDLFDLVLSGRENAMTTAVAAGLSPRRAREIVPRAIEFAELEGFEDAPLRTFSDGMRLRLAFGVMASSSPTRSCSTRSSPSATCASRRSAWPTSVSAASGAPASSSPPTASSRSPRSASGWCGWRPAASALSARPRRSSPPTARRCTPRRASARRRPIPARGASSSCGATASAPRRRRSPRSSCATAPADPPRAWPPAARSR